MPATETIVLPVGCTAEHNTCGSCKFFWRNGTERNGECSIKLPPQIVIKFIDNEIDYAGPTNRVIDDFGCSFWKSSGVTYIVQRRIEPRHDTS